MAKCETCKGEGKIPGDTNADRDVPSEAANILPGYHDEARKTICPDCAGTGEQATRGSP